MKQKKRASQKAKKTKNFGRIPQQIISSSAITGWEGLRGGRICRACPPKWARSKYVYMINYYEVPGYSLVLNIVSKVLIYRIERALPSIPWYPRVFYADMCWTKALMHPMSKSYRYRFFFCLSLSYRTRFRYRYRIDIQHTIDTTHYLHPIDSIYCMSISTRGTLAVWDTW